jgi:hypothetical protein
MSDQSSSDGDVFEEAAPPARSRPARGAARAALQKLETREEVVIGSSDEDDLEGGEEALESSSEEPEAGPAPLSAYELQRADNIARNQEVLRSLGLDKSATSGKRTKAAARSSASICSSAIDEGTAGRSGQQHARAQISSSSSSSSSSATRKRASPEGGDGAARKRPQRRSPSVSGPVAQASTATMGSDSLVGEISGLDTEEVDALFTILVGGHGQQLTASAILRTARELGLETQSATAAFSTATVESMIECFDRGGKGALSLEDFRAVVRQISK